MKLTVSRAVALATPVFSLVSAIALGWVSRHFPGLPHPNATGIVALEVTGATAAAAAAVKWLHGNSLWERSQAELQAYAHKALDVATTVEKLDPGIEATLTTDAVGAPAAAVVEHVAGEVLTDAQEAASPPPTLTPVVG